MKNSTFIEHVVSRIAATLPSQSHAALLFTAGDPSSKVIDVFKKYFETVFVTTKNLELADWLCSDLDCKINLCIIYTEGEIEEDRWAEPLEVCQRENPNLWLIHVQAEIDSDAKAREITVREYFKVLRFYIRPEDNGASHYQVRMFGEFAQDYRNTLKRSGQQS